MKTKTGIIIGILIVLLFHIGCNKEDNSNIYYAGNWVNEKNDTIYFYDSGRLLIYKNFNPYYTILYDYYMKQDSIFLFPAHSSNSDDWKGCPIQCEKNKFTLFQFNNIEKAVYKQLN